MPLGEAVIPFVARYAEGTTETPAARRARVIATLTQQLGRAPTNREVSGAWVAELNSTPVAPAPVGDLETRIRQKLENNTLTIQDSLAANQAGNAALARAINRRLAGFPWEYTWANTQPTTPTTPTTTAAPATPATPGPQVIWYDPGVWKTNPTMAYLNNMQGQTTNKFSGLGKFGSYDPATETTIQSPESMNAFNMMEIDRDPVRRDFMESVYNRHGRSWEKERDDAIRMAPMGNASTYVRNA